MEDGLEIARQRIAAEHDEKSGMLDLGRLGLEVLPDEIFELTHLRGLNLGSAFIFEEDEYIFAQEDIAPNAIYQDLAKLTALPELTALFLVGVAIPDLKPVSSLKQLHSLTCAWTRISDLTPLSSLKQLHSLDCSWTKVSDLTPLSGLKELHSLNYSDTKVRDLRPLSALKQLQTFSCSSTKVSDLTPLSGLNQLQTLTCFNTNVSDLSPLSSLQQLQTLTCFSTNVSDLSPLSSLQELQTLTCARTKVSDLSPLSSLQQLQTLTCSSTNVSDLTPLSSLKRLQRLDCSDTKVSDLTPLSTLKQMQSLNCSETKVSDLTPLSGLKKLQNLDCSATKVRDLTALSKSQCLGILYIEDCSIDIFPTELWSLGSLVQISARGAEICGLPNDLFLDEVKNFDAIFPRHLSFDFSIKLRFYNCLDAVRAHLNDLGDEPQVLNDIKLMILGNGQIGKTQICNRLRGFEFDEHSDSTHGINLTQAPVPGADALFNIWDFGGQDIYHGTHALFLRSRAVFMLVWTPDSDRAEIHQHGGMEFRNQPMAWWLDYIRRFGNDNSPLIVVQNQLDKDDDRGDHKAVRQLRDKFKFCRSIAYSARSDEGRGALNDYLNTAAKQFNPPLIGPGRLKVLRQLQAMRAEDEARPADARQSRAISWQRFEQFCADAGQISNPKQFLLFLNNAGIVFWRDGLFNDQVILDQAWVLEAIYAVFNRADSFKIIRQRRGRFTRSDLAMMVWDREGYAKQEQELFISFMQSSGICFQLRSGSDVSKAVYVAPDLLPDNWDGDERAERWGNSPADAARTVTFQSLPPALMRNFIGSIGSQAGLRCDYWRNGFYGYDSRTGAKVLVEQVVTDDWQGSINIQARGSQAERLLKNMQQSLRDEELKLGLAPHDMADKPEKLIPVGKDSSAIDRPDEIVFEHEPSAGRSYFISYAWDDAGSEEGRHRERIVDDFCRLAEENDIKIHRDKDVLQVGDSISAFMQCLARGDRVVVVLSDKYLKSPFCMTELYEIWLQARGEVERFRKRIRVFAHDDVTIRRPIERAQYAIYWKRQCKELDALIAKETIHILGDKDLLRLKYMKQFEAHIGNILIAVNDILQPQNLDQLIKYSFEDNDFDD